MRWSTIFTAACSLLALGASAIDIEVKDIKVLLTTATGGSDKTFKLQPNRPLDKPIDLETDSILRLTFTTSTPPPKYAHLEFKEKDTNTGVIAVRGKSWIYEVPIKPSDGKARFDLKSTQLPAGLRRSSGRLALSLTLSSPSTSSSSASSSGSSSPSYYSSDLLTLSLPSKRLLPPLPHRHALSTKAELDPAFRPQEEILWTFSTGEKQVGWVVGLLGSLVLLVQAGWVGGLISNLLSGRKTPSPTRNGYSFLLTLLGLEGLIVKYWINGRIYTFLPPFLGLALVSAYIGKNALRDVQVDRLASRLRA
ncbi:hypothetical protein FFLO_04631 [Filobasidium floriforme]|uniref:Dolichyl-diphosphooligosaccharide--protein glycosyltransferase subunit 2 n=1 Tax=Filobasidium floriforme TaxID=5210 RepID=A0A8K0NP25_9TREE|nr:uncharacterized protein HD553DRAFT_316293 [Filobasidium floriforme]KAG7531020.1 hypothetical protein FFLO_04631 [Filobasidium floriforme]KAH8080752.1 hypothetical protein HD553DRAFT_316293 [Filobasidium floriforme]